MSFSREELLAMFASDCQMTWATCPPLCDSETWAVETSVAAAWEDCFWDERLPERFIFDSSHPATRFGVLNVLYRVAVHGSPWTPLTFWEGTQDIETEIGCVPFLNGRGYFTRELKDAIAQRQVGDLIDLDAIRWEASVAATALMWPRFDEVIARWASIEQSPEPWFASLQIRLFRSLNPDSDLKTWAETCYEMVMGPRGSLVPFLLKDQTTKQPKPDAIDDVLEALNRYQQHETESVSREDSLGVALAEYVVGTVQNDKNRLLKAAYRFKDLALRGWPMKVDKFFEPTESASTTERRYGLMAAMNTSESFRAACLCAEKAGDFGMWREFAEAWWRWDPEKPDSARSLAKCFAAGGQYETASHWTLRAFQLDSGETDGEQATHFVQLITTVRLDRLGHAFRLTTEGLAPWAERKLRAVYKDGWRNATGSGAASPAGEVPDLMELHRLISRNLTVFGQSGKRLQPVLNRLVGLRNRWAHQQRVSPTDIERGLADSQLILRDIGAKEAEEVALLTERLPYGPT